MCLHIIIFYIYLWYPNKSTQKLFYLPQFYLPCYELSRFARIMLFYNYWIPSYCSDEARLQSVCTRMLTHYFVVSWSFWCNPSNTIPILLPENVLNNTNSNAATFREGGKRPYAYAYAIGLFQRLGTERFLLAAVSCRDFDNGINHMKNEKFQNPWSAYCWPNDGRKGNYRGNNRTRKAFYAC